MASETVWCAKCGRQYQVKENVGGLSAGKAALGAVVAGPAGAIVGAAMGKTRENDCCPYCGSAARRTNQEQILSAVQSTIDAKNASSMNSYGEPGEYDIYKKLPNSEPVATMSIDSGVQAPAEGTSVESLVNRAYIFLEDEEWDRADKYLETALDRDPECARAYMGKLLIDRKVTSLEHLAEAAPTDLKEDKNFKRATRYADERFAKEIKQIEQKIEKNVSKAEAERLEAEAERLEKLEKINQEISEKSAALQALKSKAARIRARSFGTTLYDERDQIIKEKDEAQRALSSLGFWGHLAEKQHLSEKVLQLEKRSEEKLKLAEKAKEGFEKKKHQDLQACEIEIKDCEDKLDTLVRLKQKNESNEEKHERYVQLADIVLRKWDWGLQPALMYQIMERVPEIMSCEDFRGTMSVLVKSGEIEEVPKARGPFTGWMLT